MKNLVSLILAVVLLSTSVAAQSFPKTKMVVPSGKKSRQVGVLLNFLPDKLVIQGEGIRRELLYSEITSAMYSRSKHPRWKAAVAAGVTIIGLFALPILFMKGKKHWLTVTTANEGTLLRLSKKNFRLILTTLEGHGVELEYAR